MVKRLSDQLADLSAHAKNVESAVMAAQKEGHDKLVSRTAEARASATAAVDKVKQSIRPPPTRAPRNGAQWKQNSAQTETR
jgi:phage shock protein A